MVQHSKVVISSGVGMVWKWSYTQIESHIPLSATLATFVIASYCSIGSAISRRSPRHPCGANVPNRIARPFSLSVELVDPTGQIPHVWLVAERSAEELLGGRARAELAA